MICLIVETFGISHIAAGAAVVSAVAGAAGLYIRWMLRAALAEFRADLLESLDLRYVRREEYSLWRHKHVEYRDDPGA